MLNYCAGFVFCILLSTEYADGLTFVHISLAEEEVEHVSHMNRDAVYIMVYLLFSLCLIQLFVLST